MKKDESYSSVMKRELKKGRTKGLYLFEVIYMFMVGLKDGENGIPKVDEEGVWISSMMNKEKNRYEEYCEEQWGSKEIDLREVYERCGVIKDEIPLIGKKLEVAREQEKRADPVLIERKRGEEKLSDNQVLARRKREEANRKAKNHAKVAKLEEELLARYEELLEAHNHAVEIANGTRYVCEKVMKHANQRLDIYWRAVLRVHPEKDRMPMVVAELGKPEAEDTYFEQHKGIEEEVSLVLSKYEKEVAEIRLHSIEKSEEVA